MDPVELTQELVRQASTPVEAETACAELLGGLLASHGFEVQYHEFAQGRTSVAAWRGGSPSTNKLCFAGHIDTVPLGDAEWSFPPFEGEVHDGKMYGRGTTDMKAGIASMVCAAALWSRLDEGPGVMLIMAAGEETGCEGSRPFGSELSAQHRIGALVIAEPTYNQPKVGHRGAFWVRLTATGIGAHGSMRLWDNALYKAARAVAKLKILTSTSLVTRYWAETHSVLGIFTRVRTSTSCRIKQS